MTKYYKDWISNSPRLSATKTKSAACWKSLPVITDSMYSEFVQIVIKIQRLHNHFPSLSMTYVILHDCQDLENSLTEFHGFP